MVPPFVRLDPDWRSILRRAWSVRLMAVAVVLTGIEAFFPLAVGDSVPLAFASLGFSLAAMWARIVAQRDLS